jgi:LAS superfamily LD-carboxypeptidase LdcB
VNRYLKKLEGWPAAAIAIAAAGALAWYAHASYVRLEARNAATLAELAAARDENYALIKTLAEKEGTIDSFQTTISEISSTVGTLDKLAHTDEELLKKYSKVYFLNENYSPAALTEIDRPYLVPGATNTMFLTRAYPYLEKMLKAAEADGVKLRVVSAYRSFATQAGLKSAYTVTYGSGANSFSADQGYSEHQLGTTADFSTEKLGANFNPFDKDPAYQWMRDNAYKYGFILSYPDKNSYYIYEPWHWRYVGVKLATYLHNEGKRFYDLDQREIDKYLVTLFE